MQVKTRDGVGAPYNVLVVEDHPIVRLGIQEILSQEPDFNVCGEVEDVRSAMTAIEELTPDIVVLDLSLEVGGGMALLQDICLRYEDLPVLVFSMHDERLFAERVLRIGAKGYLMKAQTDQHFVSALRKVMAGQIYVSDEIASRLLNKVVDGESPGSSNPMDSLSDRELQVFLLIGRGHTTQQIANELYLSAKTIESHRRHIRLKLGLESGTELFRQAVRWWETRSFD